MESKIVNNFSNSRQINNSIRVIPRLPLHLTKGVMACLDCTPVFGENNNSCLTDSWQATFEKALGHSANVCIIANTTSYTAATARTTPSAGVTKTLGHDTTTNAVTSNWNNATRETTYKPTEKDATVHSVCARCRKPTVALYRLQGVGTLVCRSCKRLTT